MPIRRRDLVRYSLALAGTVTVSTALGGCSLARDRQGLGRARFSHGVASGDPASDAVLLWTRAEPPVSGADVTVGWEVAADADFRRVLRSGITTTGPERDYTIKVDVRDLEPGTTYYYRFVASDESSMAGRTRTLPDGPVESVRLAVFSCSNYPAGHFHAYREAAGLANVDAFLHLGDYIYEYGAGGYATARAAELGRELPPDNAGEIYTLSDYRRRYALYRSDADLQALHAAGPMIAVWDDHEIANDAWSGGAQNHDAGEGDYDTRREAAVRAYFEWMPLRPVVPDARGRIHRSFAFGDLVALHMLDTRLLGRDRQLEYGDFVDRDSGELAVAALTEALAAPQRSLLGDEQRDWLYGSLQSSSATWQVLGQQILMARMVMPATLLGGLFVERDFTAARPLLAELVADREVLAAGGTLPAQRLRRLREALPYNLDAWDGYPAERERLYAVAMQLGKPLVVLAGDTHNAWFSELRDRHGARVGVELGTASVSSPGMESYLTLDDSAAAELAASLPALIDELQYCDLHRRGFLEVVFTRSDVTARWHFVSTVFAREYSVDVQERRVAVR